MGIIHNGELTHPSGCVSYHWCKIFQLRISKGRWWIAQIQGRFGDIWSYCLPIIKVGQISVHLISLKVSQKGTDLFKEKQSICNTEDTGDAGSISGSGRSPGGRNGNLLQYSCLGNPMDRGSWWPTVHGVAKSQTQLKQLSMHAHTHLVSWGQ